MKSDVERFIAACDNCQKSKTHSSRKNHLLKPYEPCTAPNQRVSMDLFTCVPAAGGRKVNVATFTDDFSKYCELVILEDKTAASVASAFYRRWICRHGVPDVIRHDNGAEYENQLMKEITDRLGIENLKLSSIHPAGNGGAESMNKNIISFLQTLPFFDPETWEESLAPMMLAYNTSISRATNFSPYFLMTGRTPKLGTFDPKMEKEPNTPIGEKVEKMVKTVSDSYVQANKNLKTTADKMKKSYDKNAKEFKFSEGDFVLCYFPKAGQKTKFWKAARPWCGPFRIVKKLGEQTYLIQANGKKPMQVHVNRLKQYKFGENDIDAEVWDPLSVDFDKWKAEMEKVIRKAVEQKPKTKPKTKTASTKATSTTLAAKKNVPSQEGQNEKQVEDEGEDEELPSGEVTMRTLVDDEECDEPTSNDVTERTVVSSEDEFVDAEEPETPGPRTRARGKVDDHPNVMDKPIEYRKRKLDDSPGIARKISRGEAVLIINSQVDSSKKNSQVKSAKVNSP